MHSAGVSPQSLQQKWQFQVEIGGFTAALFSKANLPEIEFEEATFAAGGSLFDQKLPGRVKFADVTLEKGVPQENPETEVQTWLNQMISVAAATGGRPSQFLRDVDVVCFDRTGREIKRYRLVDCWIKSAKFGELEGGASDNVIETLTLTYQYYQLNP